MTETVEITHPGTSVFELEKEAVERKLIDPLSESFLTRHLEIVRELKLFSIVLAQWFWSASPVWRVRWRDKRGVIFYPVHLTLSTVISMVTRNQSGVFILILMTRILDLTGNNLKR